MRELTLSEIGFVGGAAEQCFDALRGATGTAAGN